MDMNPINLTDPQSTLWMLDQMEKAMQRLNVPIEEVQRWLSGQEIPSDPNKRALFECFTNYKLLIQHSNAIATTPTATETIQIKPEPMDVSRAPSSINVNILNHEPSLTNAIPPAINVNSFLYAFPSKQYKRKNYKNRNKSKSEKLRNDSQDKKLNSSLIKVTTDKYKKLKKRSTVKPKEKDVQTSAKHGILEHLCEPIKSIKSRGGGGIVKPNKNDNYTLISRTDVEGDLEYMQWNGVSLAHCFVQRTDTILKTDQGHDVVVTEGHKCKTVGCKYPHLYSQKCHWKRHALTEHCHRKFPCPHCGAIFRQQTQRKEHIVNKHKETMVKWCCPYGCSGVFSQFRGVVRHVRLNRKCEARNKYFDEEMCGALKEKWDNDLMKHMLKFKTHTNVDESNMISKSMQAEIRKQTQELIKK